MEKRTPPAPMNQASVAQLGEGLYEIAQPPVGFLSYLVVGQERAAVIDTGMGVGSLRAEAEKLTDKPLFVINTHGHPDHAGGNAEFEETYMHPAEYDVFDRMATREFREGDISHMPGGPELAKKLQPTAARPRPLADGQEIDLGGRVLRIVFAPGHTHGSIAVWDAATGTLFTGDNAMTRTSLHEWNSSTLSEYAATLKTFMALEPKLLLCGHRPNRNEPALLRTQLSLVERALAGEKGEERELRGVKAHFLTEDGVTFDFTDDHLA